jgi:murein DD-endopeptidase MepM/ murein hydrolase activator NlpD
MTSRSHPGHPGHVGNIRHDWRWRLLAGALVVIAVTGVAGLSSSGAAPVDGNLRFAESLRAGAQSTPVSVSNKATPPSSGLEAIAALPELWADAPSMRLRYSRSLSRVPASETVSPAEEAAPASGPELTEHLMSVRPGDSLYLIFKAEGLALGDLASIVAAGKAAAVLSRLRPGDRIIAYTDASNRVQGLTHERPRGKTLNLARDGDKFRVSEQARPVNAVVVDSASTASAPASSFASASAGGFNWTDPHKPPPALERRTVRVGNGDSLYTIFKRNGFQLADLATIVKAGKDTRRLTRLLPGQRLEFRLTADNSVSSLVHYLDETRSLHVRRNGVGFDSKLIDVPLDRHLATATGSIDASLFVAGQRAGLSNKIIMQLVEIFGWDVDFALDIRSGDRFALVYEELYKNGKKLKDGNILVAMFTNQGRTTRVVRYEYADGRSAYFTPEGVSIRKAFLRSPVNYTRISSRFSLKRKHPKLHKFRAHRGVDYAAARGTPIKAAGDGKIDFVGYKGGYGKTIVLRHGAVYTTLYAHMSRFARGMRRGKRVSQGQIIGYIGSTGLATGPHLHYEFRVRGVHRNPLRVKLPRAAPIEKEHRQDFLAKTRDLVARLEVVSTPTLAADEPRFATTD